MAVISKIILYFRCILLRKKTTMRADRRSRIFFQLFFFFLSIQAFSQQPNLEFTDFNPLESLTNSKSTAIVQDSLGFVWIGTEEGLYRFDGADIYAYLPEEADLHSLPAKIVYQLFVDSRNTLWVCTNNGLCVYDRKYDQFNGIIVPDGLRGLNTAYITAIAEDRSGNIYIGSEKAVYTVGTEAGEVKKIVEVPEGRINALVFDAKDNLWIGASANGGLYYFDRENGQLTDFNQNNKTTAPREIVDMLLYKGKFWMGTTGEGIRVYDPSLKKFSTYRFNVNLENFAINLFADRQGRLWICTLGGLKLYNPSKDNFYNYFYQSNDSESIGGSLWDFYQDNNNNYWTLYSEGGVKIAWYANKFSHIDSNPYKFWHSSNKNTSSVAVDGAGNLWMGFYLNGVDIFEWRQNTTKRFVAEKNKPASLGDGSVFSIFRDSKNQMWVGTYLGGLQRFRPEDNSFETYRNVPADTLSIAGNDVRSICEDAEGHLWLALQSKGVDRFDPQSRRFYHYNKKNNQLSNDYANQVMIDHAGNLWVATVWGLNCLKKGEKLFTRYFYDKANSASLSSNDIYSIYEDDLGDIWVGTSEGLDRFHPETQTFSRFTKGLKNKHIGAILSDRNHNIWVSTNMGLSKFDPGTKQFINFSQKDGLVSSDYFDRSCYRDQNNLYFGGSDGVDFFNPDSLVFRKKKPVIMLTDFRLKNVSITWKTDSTILPCHISQVNHISLNYSDNSFSVFYQAINAPDQNEVTYAYRLTGFNNEWIDARKSRQAFYTNLNPGKYSFQVKAQNSLGDWSDVKTLEVTIVPAWWMTIWFKLLVAAIVGLTIYSLARYRIRQIQEQKDVLESQVRERTNEIRQKNEQLSQQALAMEEKNQQLHALNTTKDKLFSIVSHDLRSPFNAILGFHRILEDEYDHMPEDKRKEIIGYIRRTNEQAFDLVTNLLDWSRIQTGRITYSPVQLDIAANIRRKIDLYQPAALIKSISLVDQLPEQLFAWADINLFETTIRNILNNAVKFTGRGGTISVSARNDGDAVRITIADTGVGMRPEQLSGLFQPNGLQVRPGTEGEKGTGLGLLLCKDFIEKNKGLLTIESNEGKGSTFSFTVPAFANQHAPVV